ncbi:hypothetical protein KP509_03G101900 [Ceratopteris richardii]|uniref:Uncharacterized protein n=1 Tax=Ceratopteris richardii TaxID=49495 RepID=A0A8T2V6Q1_CERRI|nr:hypothetical protein KP509_03G101900 [Ceratopteris richardii]
MGNFGQVYFGHSNTGSRTSSRMRSMAVQQLIKMIMHLQPEQEAAHGVLSMQRCRMQGGASGCKVALLVASGRASEGRRWQVSSSLQKKFEFFAFSLSLSQGLAADTIRQLLYKEAHRNRCCSINGVHAEEQMVSHAAHRPECDVVRVEESQVSPFNQKWSRGYL